MPHNHLYYTVRDLSELGKAVSYIVGSLTISLLLSMAISYFDELDIKNKIRDWSQFFSFAFFTFCITGILVVILKVFIGRNRPDADTHFANWVFRPLNFDHLFQSFPSGHTQTVFTFAFLVAMRSRSLRAPVFIFAVLVSFSRILRNVHFLSDVMGGIFVAWIGLHLAQRLHFALISRFTSAHENAIALQAFEAP